MVIEPTGTIEGIKLSVAQKIYKMLTDGRRYFGSSGASLTHQAKLANTSGFSLSLVKTGLAAERKTTSILKDWCAKHPNAVLVDSVHIRKNENDNDGDTDHVLILGKTVIIIDTKHWKAKRKYSISAKGTVLRQGRSFPGGKIHAKEAKHMWSDYLQNANKVYSIVCINTEKVFVTYDKNWAKQPYRLLAVDKLTEELDKLYGRLDEYDQNNTDTDIVSQIALLCVKPYDIFQSFNPSMRDFK